MTRLEGIGPRFQFTNEDFGKLRQELAAINRKGIINDGKFPILSAMLEASDKYVDTIAGKTHDGYAISEAQAKEIRDRARDRAHFAEVLDKVKVT